MGFRPATVPIAALLAYIAFIRADGVASAEPNDLAFVRNSPLRAVAYPRYAPGKSGALVSLTLSVRNVGAILVRVSPQLRIVGYTRARHRRYPFEYDARPAQFPDAAELAQGQSIEFPVVPPLCSAVSGIDRVAIVLVVRAAVIGSPVPQLIDVATKRFDVPTTHPEPEPPAVHFFRVVCAP